MMKVSPLQLPGPLLIEPDIFADLRGDFSETFNAREFARATGHDVVFVQDNHATSRRGVLRGIHFQLPPHAQAKLVRAVVGEVFDVVVDLRRSSPHFGRSAGMVLSAENRHQLFVPEGFGHGYLALSEGAEVSYKAGAYFDRASERAVRWDDPTLAIAWPLERAPILSAKDAVAPLLGDAELFG